ncbi:hypothetical protein PVAP13_6KG166806 [Panicum virgatum]|uniref:Uncharacterized protein n=1 Tax=Panicum virgatum TaxID=38727 RepID=A0A8T0RDS6_PANVG|nr:hypothetical protein PVAP13_6KG166806 [Panicum virgatum]
MGRSGEDDGGWTSDEWCSRGCSSGMAVSLTSRQQNNTSQTASPWGPGSRVVRGASMAPTPEREYGTAMGDGERGE